MQANSLEELANVMGLAPEAIETFLATVKRYNELVDAGDTDFGKRPELMAKIEQPPFYGLRMNVELGVSVSGLITNADSECLTERLAWVFCISSPAACSASTTTK